MAHAEDGTQTASGGLTISDVDTSDNPISFADQGATAGVNGYGTLQSLIQLRAALAQRERPWLAVLAYGAFHDVRNTFLRKRRKRVAPYSRLGPLVQPYADLGPDGALRIADGRIDKVVAGAKQLRQSDTGESDVGAVFWDEQLAIMEDHMQDAVN